tara:strand:- start:408 stop:902 length:495 start_codon:yes stop_codon:yes gene_type:complete
MSYQHKYLKYKQKYLSLKNSLNLNMVGGNPEEPQNQDNDLLNLSALPVTPTDTEIYGHNLKAIGGEEPKEKAAPAAEDKNAEPKEEGEATSEESTSSEETSEGESSSESTSSENNSTEESEVEAPEQSNDNNNDNNNNNQTGGNPEKDTLDISELSSISDSELN